MPTLKSLSFTRKEHNRDTFENISQTFMQKSKDKNANRHPDPASEDVEDVPKSGSIDNSNDGRDPKEDSEGEDTTDNTTDKVDVFDQEMRALFEHMQNIITTNDAKKLKLKVGNQATNPILRCLNQYRKFYEKSDPADHKTNFVEIFIKHRIGVLKGYTSDAWLTKNNVIVQFGEGPKFALNRLMLSACYNTAVRLRDEALARLGGSNNNNTNNNNVEIPPEVYDDTPELTYPETFMLHLYRIFAECCDLLPNAATEKKKFGPIIAEAEEFLGIEAGESADSSPGFGGIMNLAGSLMNKFGIKPPPGTQMPSGKEIEKVFSTIFNNPQAVDVVGNLFGQLQGCSDVKEVAKTVASNLNDPRLADALADSLDAPENGDAPNSNSTAPSNDSTSNSNEQNSGESGNSSNKADNKSENKGDNTVAAITREPAPLSSVSSVSSVSGSSVSSSSPASSSSSSSSSQKPSPPTKPSPGVSSKKAEGTVVKKSAPMKPQSLDELRAAIAANKKSAAKKKPSSADDVDE